VFYTYLYQWVTDSVTALPGGGHTGAPAIATPVTVVSTCATSGDSIRLPSDIVVGGLRFEVRNDTANPLDIFPDPAHTIEGESEGAAYSLAAGEWVTFIARNSTTWMIRG
jgi:hypothetical protein